MSGFSSTWLALREPFDAAARAADLVAALPPRAASEPLEVVDLGAGAGSNLRYLAPRLDAAQRWLLVDDDADLLDACTAETLAWAERRALQASADGATLSVRGDGFALTARRSALDLARGLDRLDLPRGALVTASALLDLVGDAWLRALAARCRAARAAVLFALTYDGRTECRPAEPEDAEVLELFNRHQRTDKGFGPALGPTAAAAVRAAFAEHGYRLTERTSDWHIGTSATEMQLALIDGWTAAAIEAAPQRRDALTDWQRRRREHVARGRSELVVGHVDVAGAL